MGITPTDTALRSLILFLKTEPNKDQNILRGVGLLLNTIKITAIGLFRYVLGGFAKTLIRIDFVDYAYLLQNNGRLYVTCIEVLYSFLI
jgi:hypothetical protein